MTASLVRAPQPASALMPSAPDFHLFHTDDGPQLFLVDGSQIFKIDEELERQLAAALSSGQQAARSVLSEHGLGLTRFMGDEPLIEPPVRALSLAVAERCNLGCTYCYAEGGSFGGTPRNMPWEIAEASVRRLLAEAKPASGSIWHFSAANRWSTAT